MNNKLDLNSKSHASSSQDDPPHLDVDIYLRMREIQLDDILLQRATSIAQAVEVQLIKNLTATAPWLVPHIGRN